MHVRWIIIISFFIKLIQSMPYRIRTCTELKPLYFLDHAIPNRYALPRGVSIQYDEANTLHAYSLSQHAGSINFPAADIFTRCSFWPEEYSLLATFRVPANSEIPDWDGGYLFSLIPNNRVEVKLGLSVSRTETAFYYSDFRISPGKRLIKFNTSLFDDKWHTLILTVAGTSVGLRIDCEKQIEKTLEKSMPSFLDTAGDNIHIGNRKIQPGQFRGYLKQLLLLPGADASTLACPSAIPMLPEISRKPDVQMEAASPRDNLYQIPYDADCEWTETGKMWYDIYSNTLKVCLSGAWQQAHQPEVVSPLTSSRIQLDYFTNYQKVVTPSRALDIYVFTIPDVGQFVMMANWDLDNQAKKQESMLYKWSNKTLYPYQNITASEPSSFTSFIIENKFYLAIANMAARSANRKSVVTIFKWHNRRQRFRAVQNLPSSKPRDVEAFEINEEQYLAIANHQNDDPEGDDNLKYRAKSKIWKWDKKKELFVEYLKVDTVGAWDWTFFTINFNAYQFHCLIVANTIDKSSTDIESVLYYWDETENQLIPYQYFKTYGATDWEYFEIDGESYLAVANGYNSLNSNLTRYTTKSVIYKANIETQQFEEFQAIDTFGILDWEYFMVGNDSYLISSNQQPDRTLLSLEQKQTIIYRWQGASGFVPSHKLITAPSADWEVIHSGTDTYLIYANGAGKTTELFKAKLR